ncbi:hypothetical protein ACFL0T_04410 [Candidatus Omnitrophota bacterium]
MIKGSLIAQVLICILMVSFQSLSDAQAGEPNDLEFTCGAVVSVSSDRIVIIESDFDTNKEMKAFFDLPADVVFTNFDSLGDIKLGDIVDIDYKIKGDRNIAKSISVQRPKTMAQTRTKAGSPRGSLNSLMKGLEGGSKKDDVEFKHEIDEY